ncbi:MAG: MFS transporter [Chloroflexi bacterium]|nr:MFS transporter [Chloroflexota bacterium]
MTHELPSGDPTATDLREVGTVFHNRAFVYLWSAQALSQLAGNTVLVALMSTMLGTTGSNTMVAVLILTFLVPAVLFSTTGGVLVERSNAKVIMLATNIVRAVGVIGFIFIAPTTRDAIVPLVLALNFVIASATAVFLPAELTSIPRVVEKRHLMVANSVFILTINATFAIGFGVLGPTLLVAFGPIPIYIVTAVMFGLATGAVLLLPPIPADREAPTGGAGRAVSELMEQLREGIAFIRRHRAIAWSLAYLGIAASLIGVLGAIGPGYARDILRLSETDFFFIMGPAGIGAIVGILFLNGYGKSIPKRLLIDIALVAMGITLVLLAVIQPITAIFGPAVAPLEDVLPGTLTPLISVIAVVVVIAVFAGIEYSFVAIPSQTALQEELPSDVRGRIFGILNTLLSLASFVPVILAPAAADVINIAFPGAGIPVVMATLGLITLWAGIASWRRNAKGGLHSHDLGDPPADAVDESTAPGAPGAPAPDEPPHRRRRRRRPAVDAD